MTEQTITSVNSIGCLVLHTTCGVHAKSMQKELESFIQSNGVEWTCSRYKAIWNAALHLKNGDEDSARKVYQQNSIAYHKGSMLPKGAWKWAVSQFVQAEKPSVQRRFAGVLRFYTTLVLPEPSAEQIQKFKSAVETPPKEGCTRNAGYELARSVCSKRGCNSRVRMTPELYNRTRLHGTSYYYSDVDPEEVCSHLDKSEAEQFKSLLEEPYGKFLYSMATDTFVPTPLKKYMPYDSDRQMKDMLYQISGSHNGRIVMMQQQGCKGRTVFQPTASLQVAFAPMAECCEHFSRTLYPMEACWEDQQYGAYQAAALLSEGKSLYCVDQSSATDRFPRAISEGILDYFGMSEFADALEIVCKRPWKCDFLSNEDVTLATGQPMGLYGSFALYNLSNLMVADISEQMISKQGIEITRFPDGTCFKTVGDDIIFSDRNVAEEYRSVLEVIGVRVSELKSFNGLIAEFAGFIILPSKEGGVNAFRPYKFPLTDTRGITNPLDFLHMMGVRATKLKDPKWKLYFEAYQATLSQRSLDLAPFGCLRIPALDGPEPKELTNLIGKETSVLSLDSAIHEALYKASETSSNRILNAIARCDKHTSDKFSEIPELSLRGKPIVFGSARTSVYQDRVIAYTGSKPAANTPSYDAFIREDYRKWDKISRKRDHHQEHRTLQMDPLISEYVYERLHRQESSSPASHDDMEDDIDFEL